MQVREVSVSELRRRMVSALVAREVDAEASVDVAAGLIRTYQRGVSTHGIALFPVYLDELKNGQAVARPRLSWTRGRGGLAHLDAGGALGIVAGMAATRQAIASAREFGVAAVVVANSNHFGAASIYSLALAEAGLLGLAASNSDALVVPAGGARKMFGTNPISMAMRGQDGELFCTDLATSQGSFLRSLRTPGNLIPNAVVADELGHDAKESGRAPVALLPLGGYKGQCLGMMVELLCALLGGGPFDHELRNLFAAPFDRPREMSHFFLAIDPSALPGASNMAARLAHLMEEVRAVPPSGDQPVCCPGDRERVLETERADMLPVGEEDYRWIAALPA